MSVHFSVVPFSVAVSRPAPVAAEFHTRVALDWSRLCAQHPIGAARPPGLCAGDLCVKRERAKARSSHARKRAKEIRLNELLLALDPQVRHRLDDAAVG